MSRRALSLLAAVACLAAGTPLLAAAETATKPCAAKDPGGAWPTYGRDASNSRTQTGETSLAPSPAAPLVKAWVFTTTDGAIENTPVVAHGCAYVTTTGGGVYALDMTTGKQVWQRTLPAAATTQGGAIPGSAAVVGDQVLVLVSQAGAPYAASLDARTGALQWRSAPVSTQNGVYTNASAAVHDGVLVFGYSPPEGDDNGQGGVALLDTATGAVLANVPTVSAADQAQGFAGGGIWSTAAFDHDGNAYVGAGNPFSKTKQDPHTDAILKIDVDRGRSTFGQVVGFYDGNVDQYDGSLQQLSQTPVCAASDGGLPTTFDDPACGQLDLDFGASPNLFPGADGGLDVGDLQKSGEYHVAHAADMTADWHALVGGTCQACNAASTAYDGSTVYAIGTPGGVLSALDAKTGALRWAEPVADGVHFQALSVANGVVYTVDGDGFLDAWSAATGQPLAKQPVSAGSGAPVGGLGSNGIAIADHTVLVAASSPDGAGAGTGAPTTPTGYLVAYRAG